MDGYVFWPQLIFAAVLVVGSFAMAFRVLSKLTDILVQMERMATRDDLSSTKSDIYKRMDLQWNAWQSAHGDLRDRVSTIEGWAKRVNGGTHITS